MKRHTDIKNIIIFSNNIRKLLRCDNVLNKTIPDLNIKIAKQLIFGYLKNVSMI